MREPHVEHLKRDSIIARDALEESLYGGWPSVPTASAAAGRAGEIRVWSLLRPPTDRGARIQNNAMTFDSAQRQQSPHHLFLDTCPAHSDRGYRHQPLLPATTRCKYPPPSDSSSLQIQVRVPLVVSGESSDRQSCGSTLTKTSPQGKPEDLLSDCNEACPEDRRRWRDRAGESTHCGGDAPEQADNSTTTRLPTSVPSSSKAGDPGRKRGASLWFQADGRR